MTKCKSTRFHDLLQAQLYSPLLKGGKALVYCYLRQSDGSPYYVGVASTSDRPASKYHATKPPRDRRYIRVLKHGITRSQAWEWEKYYIAKYGRKDIATGILHNKSNGGEGNNGFKHTEETRARVSALMRGRKQTPEWVQKRTSLIRGENNGMFGRKHTPEAKARMSAAHKGKKRKPLSEEARRNIAIAAKTRKKPQQFKPHTEEVKEKLRISGLERHRKARQERAEARGVTVEELLKLEKKERNRRSYENWRARQAEQAA